MIAKGAEMTMECQREGIRRRELLSADMNRSSIVVDDEGDFELM